MGAVDSEDMLLDDQTLPDDEYDDDDDVLAEQDEEDEEKDLGEDFESRDDESAQGEYPEDFRAAESGDITRGASQKHDVKVNEASASKSETPSREDDTSCWKDNPSSLRSEESKDAIEEDGEKAQKASEQAKEQYAVKSTTFESDQEGPTPENTTSFEPCKTRRLAKPSDSDEPHERRSIRQARRDMSQLENELFEASSKLVAEAEKNASLSRRLSEIKAERDRLRRDAQAARGALLERISARRLDNEPYKHVSLAQLVALREKAIDLKLPSALSVPRGASASDSTTWRDRDEPLLREEMLDVAVKRLEEENTKLRARLRKADEDKDGLRSELKSAQSATEDVNPLKNKLAEMLNRARIEKELRTRAEDEAKISARKVAALTDHVEKLMVHLKHEVAAKISAKDQLRKAEREIDAVRQRNTMLLKRNNAREKFLLELKEGSKILEDQLRLMDRRYLELRAKLDWTRHHADRQVKKATIAATKLRAKFAACNSQSSFLATVQPSAVREHDIKTKKPQTAPAAKPATSLADQTKRMRFASIPSAIPSTV